MSQTAIFLDHNLKLHKMIDMHLKYDNMHTNGTFNVLNCMNNHVDSCINCMLSTSTSGIHVFLASRSSWVIDSGASAHMIGTPSTLSYLTPTTTYPPISIADGHSCFLSGYGSTKPTPSLTRHNVLYVPGFPSNLLSITTITRTLNYVAIFYPFHCVF